LHRLPEPIEDEHRMVERACHTFSQQLPRKLAGSREAARKRSETL
jgi:hypothetical protein